MLDVLNAFIVELRHAGIPVSLTEHVDAAHATAAIDLGDRATFKAALRATLVKSEDHRPAFDTAFEVYFAGREALEACLLYTSPSPRDRQKSRMPSSA